jgi:hypothetical protein
MHRQVQLPVPPSSRSAFFLFITLLACLAIAIAAIALGIIHSLMHEWPVQNYLLEIILAAAAVAFFLPVFKLFTYHVGLFHSRKTTNEDLKELYAVIDGPVPFERCQNTARPPLAPLNATLILNVEHSEPRSTSFSREQNHNKGKRYSILVSDRQSVLNSLVEAEL